MESLALIRPQGASLDLPRKPVRVLGIDLGTTNSAIAEVVWQPGSPDPIRARCLEVAQETMEGEYIHVLVPSVVALQSGRVIVGEGAKRLRIATRWGPANTQVGEPAERILEQYRDLFYECKNDIGIQRTYNKAPEGFRSAAEIGSHVLEFLHSKAVANHSAPVAKIVVTVPASFDAAQRTDTLRAANLAGLELEAGDLLDEPVGAFLDYLMSRGGVDLDQPGAEKKLVVFDFGGGTCDVAVFSIVAPQYDAPINISSLSVSRYHRLGGGDIDAAILYEVLIPELMEQNGLSSFDLSFEDKKKFIEPALLGVAEALKIDLCVEISRLKQSDRYKSSNLHVLGARAPGSHKCVLRGRTLTLQSPKLTAAQFEDLLAPFLDQDLLYARETEYRLSCSLFAPLQDALERSGLEPENIDYCLLVGGSSLIPQVVDAVKTFFLRAKLLMYGDRDSFQMAVARGAAYHALARALFGRGVVQPISNEQISIRTEAGEEILIPMGATLPYPPNGSRARISGLAVPHTVITGSLPLLVEVIAGSEGRMLDSRTWAITGPVNRGEPLTLEYSLNENQVLDLRLRLTDTPSSGEYEWTIKNPLTNVVNPTSVRLQIAETEEQLRTGKVPREQQADTLSELAGKYDDLGQREKALEYLGRAMRGKGRPDPWILNRMAIVAGELGDYEREEKFYREAASISRGNAPWFNLALMQRRLGRVDPAIESIERAMRIDRDAPCLVLRALLAEKQDKQGERDKYLAEAVAGFGPVSALSDFELGWLLTAARMAGDEKRETEVNLEQRRRVRPEGRIQSAEGALPIQREGLRKAEK
jgi:molecular chaperone DnaK